MDPLHLSEEIKQLKRLGEFYEDQLKSVGVEMCELGDGIHKLLDESVELQRVTNLKDLRLSNLHTYYYKKKKEHLDYNAIIADLKKEISNQQQEIEMEQNECNLLEKFTNSINKRLVTEAQMQSSKLDIESSMKSLQEHLDSLEIPEDFNIDELIRKVEHLKTEKCKEKKETPLDNKFLY